MNCLVERICRNYIMEDCVEIDREGGKNIKYMEFFLFVWVLGIWSGKKLIDGCF